MHEIAGRNWRVIIGDVRDGLRTLPANSVQCCVTSPPYWGLRDYGTAKWEGGDSTCDHAKPGREQHMKERGERDGTGGGVKVSGVSLEPFRDRCGKCGATRIDQQIGLEPTPEAFTAAMVEVFEEVRRVLRPDGVCFVNIGDSYARAAEKGGSGPNGKHDFIPDYGNARKIMATSQVGSSDGNVGRGDRPGTRAIAGGLKPKDLCGIPWRLAFALQSAGWWLRSEIIWHKRTPMPESVTDRPTKSHEQIFLLTKSADYFWDQEAVKEEAAGGTPGNVTHKATTAYHNGDSKHRTKAGLCEMGAVETRNIRTVWTLSAESFPGAHFATFPSSIPLRCIKAGTSERGACPICGAPWERITAKERRATRPGHNSKVNRASDDPGSPYEQQAGMIVGNRDPKRHTTVTSTTGWQPTCQCGHAETVPCVVLDPFSGSGTTGMVATELGRIYIGCELNPEYAEMSRIRIDSWKHRDTEKAVASLPGQRGLFDLG